MKDVVELVDLPDELILYRVLWGNSDQKFENSFCFCWFSLIVHRKEVIFGS